MEQHNETSERGSTVSFDEAFSRAALAPTPPSFRKALRKRYGVMVASGDQVDLRLLDGGPCEFALVGASVTARGS